MRVREFVFALAILMPACGTPTNAPPQAADPPGILQRFAERAREATTKLQDVGGAVLGFFGTYYEDHIQPIKDSYVEWASGIKGAMWDKIQTTIDDYAPKKAN